MGLYPFKFCFLILPNSCDVGTGLQVSCKKTLPQYASQVETTESLIRRDPKTNTDSRRYLPVSLHNIDFLRDIPQTWEKYLNILLFHLNSVADPILVP